MSAEEEQKSASDSRTAPIADDEALAKLGYSPELKRSFGLVGMVGFSFSIVTCEYEQQQTLPEYFEWSDAYIHRLVCPLRCLDRWSRVWWSSCYGLELARCLCFLSLRRV